MCASCSRSREAFESAQAFACWAHWFAVAGETARERGLLLQRRVLLERLQATLWRFPIADRALNCFDAASSASSERGGELRCWATGLFLSRACERGALGGFCCPIQSTERRETPPMSCVVYWPDLMELPAGEVCSLCVAAQLRWLCAAAMAATRHDILCAALLLRHRDFELKWPETD